MLRNRPQPYTSRSYPSALESPSTYWTGAIVAIVLAVLLLAFQPADTEPVANRYQLTVKLRGDTTLDRTWVEAAVERTATASEDDDYTLQRPYIYKIGSDGTVFVTDFEDQLVKAFTTDGDYVTTYGEGPGPNPGELTRPTSVGLKGDSLLYVTEPRLQRVSYFAKDGSFVRTERYEELTPYQIAWTDGPTQYTFPPPTRPGTFLHRSAPDRVRQIGPPSRVEEPILLDGVLHSTGDKIVFVMRYLPVILTYSADDLAGTAFPTPDYGEALPSPQRGGRMVPQAALNGQPTVSGGVLSIQVPAEEAGNLAFDLYDVDSMAYVRTIQFPIEVDRATQGRANVAYAHGSRALVTVQDAVVTFYRVTMP